LINVTMARPGVCGAAALLIAAASACDPSVPVPVRVLPPDGGSTQGTARAQVVASRASLTEDPPRVDQPPEQVVVGITLLNVGEAPVENELIRDGRVGWLGVAMDANFVRAAAWDASPFAPGEQRELLFVADVVPLGVCTSATIALPNPHHGLVTVGLTLLSSGGAWALAGIDAAVTCTTGTAPPSAPPKPPSGDVEF
jgi:hypothetical protein